ncbi:hypothetical protein [Novosphingobium soli]|uniref:Uncharacterized protein n=1 Tax=Novosphingobium soli TaxID=574956 RepID=A0ABV6CX18_9SPHN
MKVHYLLLTTALLAAYGSNRPANEPDGSQSAVKSGEKIIVFPVEPHQWRKDPDCYVSQAAFDLNNEVYPEPQALRWRKQRKFSGYLFTNFEGASFVSANRGNDPHNLGLDHYQTSIHYNGSDIPFAPEPRVYWISFTGREALCNSQRPDEAHFDLPSSPNLVIIDQIAEQIRMP